MAADRNLLCGLVALQMGLVSKDQLVEALRAWALDTTTPLAALLLRRGWLAAEQHRGLLPRVERLLESQPSEAAPSLDTVRIGGPAPRPPSPDATRPSESFPKTVGPDHPGDETAAPPAGGSRYRRLRGHA